MVAIGDVLQITHRQFNTVANVEFENVYKYIVDELPPIPDWDILFGELQQNFRDTVVAKVREVQTTQIQHTAIIIENLFSPYEQFEYPINPVLTGVVAGPTAPSFVTLGFKLVRSTKLTGNGRKGIGGISDGYAQGDNGVSLGANIHVVELRQAMAAVQAVESDFGQDALYSPVIARKLAVGTDQFVINRVSNVQYRKKGTQDSRKK